MKRNKGCKKKMSRFSKLAIKWSILNIFKMVKTGVIVSSIAFHRGKTHENRTILLKVMILDVT